MSAPSTNSIVTVPALGGDALVTDEQARAVTVEAYLEAKASLDEQVRVLKEDLHRRSERVNQTITDLNNEVAVPGVFEPFLDKSQIRSDGGRETFLVVDAPQLHVPSHDRMSDELIDAVCLYEVKEKDFLRETGVFSQDKYWFAVVAELPVDVVAFGYSLSGKIDQQGRVRIVAENNRERGDMRTYREVRPLTPQDLEQARAGLAELREASLLDKSKDLERNLENVLTIRGLLATDEMFS